MIANGQIGFLPRLLSAYRMTIEDYALQYKYVKNLNIFENTTQTTLNKSETSKKTPDAKKVVGRPALDDDEIEDDNTAASKEGGANVSENK